MRLGLARGSRRLLYPLLALDAGPQRQPSGIRFEAMRRIVVLRELYTLGDALVATPAVRALHRAYPDLEIGLVAGWRNAAVWRHNPALSRLFVLGAGVKPVRFAETARDVRAWGPDACLTLVSIRCHATLDMLARMSGAPVRIRYDAERFGGAHSNVAYNCIVPLRLPREAHQIDVCSGVLQPFGVEVVDRSLELEPGPEAEERARQVLRAAEVEDATPFVVIHPGSKQVHNRWPLERFLEVREHCVRAGFRALLSFGPSEERARAWFVGSGVPAHDLLPPLAIEELAALLRRARLLVCPDTGVLHVGATTGVPIVGLYGSGDPAVWQPPGRIRAVSDHARGNVRAIESACVIREVEELIACTAGPP